MSKGSESATLFLKMLTSTGITLYPNEMGNKCVRSNVLSIVFCLWQNEAAQRSRETAIY